MKINSWIITDCPCCEDGIVGLTADDEMILCPRCGGYGEIPEKLKGIMLLCIQEFNPRFQTKKEAQETIELG
jgi:hypothetical protein